MYMQYQFTISKHKNLMLTLTPRTVVYLEHRSYQGTWAHHLYGVLGGMLPQEILGI
jgi:hypothetical protein